MKTEAEIAFNAAIKALEQQWSAKKRPAVERQYKLLKGALQAFHLQVTPENQPFVSRFDHVLGIAAPLLYENAVLRYGRERLNQFLRGDGLRHIVPRNSQYSKAQRNRLKIAVLRHAVNARPVEVPKAKRANETPPAKPPAANSTKKLVVVVKKPRRYPHNQ